jgi:hypothetical protein
MPAALARWTPVALNLEPGGASIDWGDLTTVRFAEPFFHHTVERWAGGEPAPLARTGLDALAALDVEPSLDPCALIFHVARCGSTLLSRLLGAVPGVLVLSEPAPVNALLLADPASLGAMTQVEALRLLVRALGWRRFGDERHYVLKLSSWNVTRLDLFRRAFPRAALIWLQRAPHEVVASLAADPPGWLAQPDLAGAIFGLEAAPAASDEFCVRAVEAVLSAARAVPDWGLVLDHADLPQAAWRRVAPFLGLDLAPADIACMERTARLDAKEPTPRPFSRDRSRRPPLPEACRAMLAGAAEPLYAALERRREGRDLAAPACL